MIEQPSLKERALAARDAALVAQVWATHEANARHRAEAIQRLVSAWAGLGVVVCACQVRENDNGQFYFGREGYLLGLGRYDAPAIYHEDTHYWEELTCPESDSDALEVLAAAMLRIDAWREKHRHWLAERGQGPCDPASCPTCELDLQGQLLSTTAVAS